MNRKYTYLLSIIMITVVAVGGWVYLHWSPKQIASVDEIPCEEKTGTIPSDAKSVAPNSQYLKDTKHVYLHREDERGVVPGADPTTFRTVPDIDEFGMDTYHVYYAGCQLPDANPETFKHLPSGTYGTDTNHVYWRWKKLIGVDASKFVSLPRGYGKDSVIVYWEDEKIEGADSATFESFEDKPSCSGSCTITARDKNHTYMLDKIVQ